MSVDNARAELTLVVDGDGWAAELPAELVEWVLVYFDYLVSPEGPPPPEPPAEFAEEAKQLAAALREGYGFATEEASASSTEVQREAPIDSRLAACVTAARPAVSRPFGDSSVARHLLRVLKRIRRNIERTTVRKTDAVASFLLSTKGTTPALGTIVATVLAPIAGGLFLAGHALLAGIVMVLLAGAELVDSALAKRARNPRRAVLFDQIADRVSDVALFGAFALWGFHHDLVTGWAAVATLVAALIGSYVWAMTAALRLPPPEAHVGRAERIAAVTAGVWMTPLFPVGAIRIALIVSAVSTAAALLERVFCAARTTTTPQPQWLGARGESWAEGEYVPRLVEKIVDEDGRLLVVEVHTTGTYKGSSHDADVVAVLQKRGKQLCVEYFHPSTTTTPSGPDEHQRASNE